MKKDYFSYRTAEGHALGTFSIHQGRGGGIVMAMGSAHTLLTGQQIEQLGIHVYGLPDFDIDAYISHYRPKAASGEPREPAMGEPRYSDLQLMEELQERGYCTGALWSLADVRSALDTLNREQGTAHVLEDYEGMEILGGLFGADADMSAENEMLENAIREYLTDGDGN